MSGQAGDAAMNGEIVPVRLIIEDVFGLSAKDITYTGECYVAESGRLKPILRINSGCVQQVVLH